LLAISHVLANNRVEVVDVVEVDVVELLHVWIHVTRNGNVDEDQRAIPTPLHHVFDIGAIQERFRGTGRNDNNIRVGDCVKTVFESHSAGSELDSQFDSAIE